jgi:hypothetical protein
VNRMNKITIRPHMLIPIRKLLHYQANLPELKIVFINRSAIEKAIVVTIGVDCSLSYCTFREG